MYYHLGTFFVIVNHNCFSTVAAGLHKKIFQHLPDTGAKIEHNKMGNTFSYNFIVFVSKYDFFKVTQFDLVGNWYELVV